MLRWAPYPSAGIVRIRFKGTADRIRISGSGPPLGSADTVSGVGVECECLDRRLPTQPRHVPLSPCSRFATRIPLSASLSRRWSRSRRTPAAGCCCKVSARIRPSRRASLLRPDPGRSARPRPPGRRHTRFRNPRLRVRWGGQSVHADHVDVHARRLVPHPWQHVVSVGLRRQRGRRDGPVSLRRLLRSLRPRSSLRADRDRPRQAPCRWWARPAPSAASWALTPYSTPGPTCTRSSSSASTRPRSRSPPYSCSATGSWSSS